MTRNEKILYDVLDMLVTTISLMKQTDFYKFAVPKLKSNLTRIETVGSEFLKTLQRGNKILVVRDFTEKELAQGKKIKGVKFFPNKKSNCIYFGKDIRKIANKKMIEICEEAEIGQETVKLSELNVPEYFEQFLSNFFSANNYLEKAKEKITSLSKEEMKLLEILTNKTDKISTFIQREIFLER